MTRKGQPLPKGNVELSFADKFCALAGKIYPVCETGFYSRLKHARQPATQQNFLSLLHCERVRTQAQGFALIGITIVVAVIAFFSTFAVPASKDRAPIALIQPSRSVRLKLCSRELSVPLQQPWLGRSETQSPDRNRRGLEHRLLADCVARVSGVLVSRL